MYLMKENHELKIKIKNWMKKKLIKKILKIKITLKR